MSLSEKYKVPQETIKKMVNDGVISTTWPAYEDIYAMYKQSMSIGGKSKTQIFYEISEKMKMSDQTVKKIVYLMDKIG